MNLINDWLIKSLLGAASWLFNIYFGIVGNLSASDLITGSFSTLFNSTTVWNFVHTAHQTFVIPLAESILALFMLVQLIKISQRIDATATLPAVKDIVFLAVEYVLFHWLIVNSLDVITAIYDSFNSLNAAFGSANPSASVFNGALDLANTVDVSKASFGGCFALVIVALLSAFTGMLAFIIGEVVALARAMQLYVMAAFAPIPLALLGFDETRQMGIGFLKNFCAVALAGCIMLFLLAAYPYIVTSLVSSLGSTTFEDFAMSGGGEEIITLLESLLTWLALTFFLILGLVRSGAWAKDILGG